MALDQLRGLLTKSVDFAPFAAAGADPEAPQLLLGAVDVVSGEFKAFDSRRERDHRGRGAGVGGDPDPVPVGA